MTVVERKNLREILGNYKETPEYKIGEYELYKLTPLALQRYVKELLKDGNIVTCKGLSANKIKHPKGNEVSCLTLSEQKRIEWAVLSSKKPNLP